MLTSNAIPRLRPDLEPHVMAEDGRTVVVLADPASGRHYRLREVEGTILALLDGRRDLSSVHGEVTRAFPGRPLSTEAVRGFVAHAERLGLLEGSQAAAPERTFLQRLLFLKVPLANPDRLLGRIYERLSFLYHPWTWAISLLLVLAALGVAVTSWDDLRRSFVPPAQPGSFFLYWASISVITLIHEMGHGLTCKHFGARATGFGLLFVYLLPCFYCDVSGAWTLRRRSQRLWVGAAGLCFQFVAGAVALLVWRIVEPGSLAGRAAIAMVSMCGLDALLNLVPLIRLDGYYLLSDWLEIPNLRPRALGYVGGRIRAVLLGLSGPEGNTTPRQARVFLVYGTLAGLFAAAMVVLSSASMYGWLHGRFGGLGVLPVAVLLLLLFANVARRLVSLWLTAFRATQPARAAHGQLARQETGVPASRGAQNAPHRAPNTEHRTPSPRLRAIALAAALPAVAAALALGKSELYVVGPCRLEAKTSVPVRVAREGVLAELRYREGDRVREGATLGLLDTFSLRKEMTSLEARAGMLRVEAEIARQQVPLVAAQREGAVAEVDVEIPRAQVALEEVSEVQRYRLAEADDRVAEAHAALVAVQRRAFRLRRDATRAVEGNYPPALQAHVARVEKVAIEEELGDREVRRLTPLVNEGALAPQALDVVRARYGALQKERRIAENELLAAAKLLREEADDAEAEVERRRAAYHAAQQAYRQAERQRQSGRPLPRASPPRARSFMPARARRAPPA
jgi:hypothetical protein